MLRFLVILLPLLPAMAAAGFSSGSWMAERDDDADALRLASSYADCRARATTPAEDVVFPIETYPDGTVKSRLYAKRAQMFMDTNLIWGEGVRVEQYKADGRTRDGELLAENVVVDRNTRTGYVPGRASLAYGDTVVSGRSVYFSVRREFVKIFNQSRIRSKSIKIDARRFKQ